MYNFPVGWYTPEFCGNLFPIAHTSVTRKKCFRIICVIISGIVVMLSKYEYSPAQSTELTCFNAHDILQALHQILEWLHLSPAFHVCHVTFSVKKIQNVCARHASNLRQLAHDTLSCLYLPCNSAIIAPSCVKSAFAKVSLTHHPDSNKNNEKRALLSSKLLGMLLQKNALSMFGICHELRIQHGGSDRGRLITVAPSISSKLPAKFKHQAHSLGTSCGLPWVAETNQDFSEIFKDSERLSEFFRMKVLIAKRQLLPKTSAMFSERFPFAHCPSILL